MSTIQELQDEIERIKARNKRVEADKTWETSWIRRIAIALSTYTIALLLMLSIGVEKPIFTALIPTFAYFLSTATLRLLKSWWLKTQH